jgi:hypothetical protein
MLTQQVFNIISQNVHSIHQHSRLGKAVQPCGLQVLLILESTMYHWQYHLEHQRIKWTEVVCQDAILRKDQCFGLWIDLFVQRLELHIHWTIQFILKALSQLIHVFLAFPWTPSDIWGFDYDLCGEEIVQESLWNVLLINGGERFHHLWLPCSLKLVKVTLHVVQQNIFHPKLIVLHRSKFWFGPMMDPFH